MKLRFALLFLLIPLLVSGCGISLAEDITPPPDYQSPTPGPTKSPLYPLTPMNLANGQSIYTEKCAPCHGDQGLGDGSMASSLQVPPKAIGDPSIASRASLVNWYTTVTEGNINSFMPPFNGSLSDAERWDVVAYSLSLGGFNLDSIERGKQAYTQSCEECHGPDGKLVSTADFSDQIMMSKLSQNDIINFIVVGVGEMKGFGDSISTADLEAIAAYLRSKTLDMENLPATEQSSSTETTTTESDTTDSTTAEAVGTGTGTTDTTAESNPTETDPVTAETEPENAFGEIFGLVTNGSASAPASGVKVVLHGFTHDFDTQQFTEQLTLDTLTDSSGNYKFSSIDLLKYQAFYISIDQGELVYASEPAFSTGAESELTIPLTIYDTTTDKSGIVVDQTHIILNYTQPDTVQVIEFIILSNNSNATVIGTDEQPGIVNIPLPDGYQNLQFEEGVLGERYLETENGFADTLSIYPGAQSQQIVFAFDLPLEQSSIPFFGKPKVELNQTFELNTKAVSVLVPEGIKVNAPGMGVQPITDMGNGTKYQTFIASPNVSNYEVAFTAEGTLSGSAVSSTNSQTGMIIGIAALGVVLILVSVILYIKNRKAEDELLMEIEDEEESEGELTQDAILDAIIALDDQYKAGNISEKAYHSRRQDLINLLSNAHESE